MTNRATGDKSSIQFAAFHTPPPIQNKKMVEPILGFLMQELLKINWENIANERSSN